MGCNYLSLPFILVCGTRLLKWQIPQAQIPLESTDLTPDDHTLKTGVNWTPLPTPFAGDHFVYAPSQWEATLQCNVVSDWLGVCTEWSCFWITLSWHSMAFFDTLCADTGVEWYEHVAQKVSIKASFLGWNYQPTHTLIISHVPCDVMAWKRFPHYKPPVIGIIHR